MEDVGCSAAHPAWVAQVREIGSIEFKSHNHYTTQAWIMVRTSDSGHVSGDGG